MSKRERLDKLYEGYQHQHCGEEFVSGYGNIDSKILLIGEAPGREEVKLGRPFVGSAGKNLENFLVKLEITREDIYTTNAIKYRLSRISEKTGGKVNRPAAAKEIETSLNTLYDEIDIIKPSFVITLGNVPLKAITYNSFRPIGEVHGESLLIKILGNSYNLIPLYHPASLIYNRKLENVYDSDIEKLKKYLESMKKREIPNNK